MSLASLRTEVQRVGQTFNLTQSSLVSVQRALDSQVTAINKERDASRRRSNQSADEESKKMKRGQIAMGMSFALLEYSFQNIMC